MSNTYITDKFLTEDYARWIDSATISKMITLRNKISYLAYIIIPSVILIKCYLVCLCLWIGSFFNNSKIKISKLFKVVIVSELVVVFFSFIKTGLLFYYKFQSMAEIENFQPFTLFSLLNVNNIPEYFHYPLSLISIPEAIYWVVLALLLKPLIIGNFWNRLGFIAKTYGIGLLIWVSIVVFATLNFTT